MTYDLELYIGDRLVEFNTQPDILYTYSLDNVQNPTAVKNSFTKTINIPGTKINDQIFGEFWKLDRTQGTGGLSGVEFNSSKKVDFQLFINGDLYETGYVKLDNVTDNGPTRTYAVTLYGGLGDFFYNLMTRDADGEKLKLSDLDFNDDLDYTINIDTVKQAWDNIDNNNSKWSTINFAPAYNGIGDFDASHVVINTKDTTFEKTAKDENGNIFSTRNGFTLGNLITDLTEHEMRDYRSYLNRPVIRMKKIIEACCNEEINGGYKVNLDPEFFNDNNPYWNDTWLTLPMIQNLELSNSQQVLEGASLVAGTTYGDNDADMYNDLELTLGNYPESISELGVKCTIATQSANHYASHVNTDWFGKHYWLGSLFVQLLAYSGDRVVGASKTYNMTNWGQEDNTKKYGTNSDYTDYKAGYYTPNQYNKEIQDVVGIFDWNGFYVNQGTPYVFDFKITNLNAPVTGLKLRFFWGANKKKISKSNRKNVLYVYNGGYKTDSSSVDKQFIVPKVVSTDFSAVLGESLGRTGTEINKYSLLNTENSPADYLLSYAKMFGLYFWKDPVEKEISILTRNNYYQKEDIIDLTDYIDLNSELKITPTVFNTRWITFSPNQDESEFFKRYKLTEGVNYGDKLVNTGYDFDGDKFNTIKDNCIKAAIEGHEKSKYFSQYSGDASVRPWMIGMTYNLYKEDETLERTPEVIGGTLFGINENEGMKFYDLFPKVQFHSDNNNPTDGNDCLIFYNGKINLNTGRANKVNYILSDDTRYQTALNDGSPCWLFSNRELDDNGDRMCYKLSEIPVFERYKTSEGSYSVQQSLDFGAPRQLYAQLYEYGAAKTIYDGFWSDYLSDLYDVNTKVLNCSVNVGSRKINEWLRKFFWYENSLWRINKITDYNISTPNLTNIEFIKVQDFNNYSNKIITQAKSLRITLSKYSVSPEGETIQATVHTEDGNCWTLSYTEGLVINTISGCGTRTFDVRVPEKRNDSVNRYTIIARSDDNQASATITQNGEGFIVVEERGIYIGKNIPTNGGELQLNVKSVYPWHLESSRDDVMFSIKSGNGDPNNGEDITVVFPESNAIVPITIEVVFTDDYGKTARWTKTQDPIKELVFPADGDCKTVFAGVAGIAFTTPDWVSVTDNGDGYYEFCASRNTGSERKNGVNGTVPETRAEPKNVSVTVRQEEGEPVFEVSPTEMSFTYIGGTQSAYINNPNNCEWTIKSKPDWLSVSPQSGKTSGIINVVANQNDGEAKSDKIIIHNEKNNKDYEIIVNIAEAPSIDCISLDRQVITIPYDGGSVEVNLDACGDWISEYLE